MSPSSCGPADRLRREMGAAGSVADGLEDVATMLAKLGVTSRAEAVAIIVRHGLV